MTMKALDVEDLVREDRVKGAIYTDPAIFEMEMEKLFRNSWSFVAHETQVSEPGDYFSTFIGRQPVIVARGADDGEVRIFYNRCRHRGNIVCQYEQGNASFFRCAYHGWTFNNKGRLIGVPLREAYGSFLESENMNLIEVAKVGVYQGFIFAALGSDVPPLEEWIGPAHRYLDAVANQGPHGIEVTAGCQKALYRGNWKFQNENDADSYHGLFTHQVGNVLRAKRAAANGKPIPRGTGQPADSRIRALGHGHSVNHYQSGLGPEREGSRDLYEQAKSGSMTKGYVEALEKKVGAEAARELLRNAGNPPYTFRMFPNLVLISTQIRVTRPVSVGVAENYYYPTMLKGVPDEVNAIRLRNHESGFGPAGFTSADDVEVFARNQLGLSSKGNDWQIMTRGAHREQVDEDGVRWSDVKDETGMRSIYQEWKRVMGMP